LQVDRIVSVLSVHRAAAKVNSCVPFVSEAERVDSSWELVWLCLSALAAGAVNSIAGGGTLLTFPALLAGLTFLGAADAAVVANATSTVALVPGSLAGAWGYRREIRRTRRWLYLLVGPSLAGGVIGALLVTRLAPAYFAALVPWLLLTAALLFLAESFLPEQAAADPKKRTRSISAVAASLVFQLVVAVYGGYFGAGASILILSALAALRVGDVNQMNALKTILSSCINGISVVVFIAEQKVAWNYALPMMAAAILGGYLGARLALVIETRHMKLLISAIGLCLAAYFFLR
jgi:uncharacterized membrane protein YfcA